MSRTRGSRNTRSRADAYPEEMTFRDTGCDVSPTCLGCPLAVCRYDHPAGLPGILADERRARLRELAGTEFDVEGLAAEMGCSKRTVFRLRQEVVSHGRP